MGAKYHPNVKDQKANERFQKKQGHTSKFIPASTGKAAKSKRGK